MVAVIAAVMEERAAVAAAAAGVGDECVAQHFSC
jgi:hypothetical protein